MDQGISIGKKAVSVAMSAVLVAGLSPLAGITPADRAWAEPPLMLQEASEEQTQTYSEAVTAFNDAMRDFELGDMGTAEELAEAAGKIVAAAEKYSALTAAAKAVTDAESELNPAKSTWGTSETTYLTARKAYDKAAAEKFAGVVVAAVAEAADAEYAMVADETVSALVDKAKAIYAAIDLDDENIAAGKDALTAAYNSFKASYVDVIAAVEDGQSEAKADYEAEAAVVAKVKAAAGVDKVENEAGYKTAVDGAKAAFDALTTGEPAGTVDYINDATKSKLAELVSDVASIRKANADEAKELIAAIGDAAYAGKAAAIAAAEEAVDALDDAEKALLGEAEIAKVAAAKAAFADQRVPAIAAVANPRAVTADESWATKIADAEAAVAAVGDDEKERFLVAVNEALGLAEQDALQSFDQISSKVIKAADDAYKSAVKVEELRDLKAAVAGFTQENIESGEATHEDIEAAAEKYEALIWGDLSEAEKAVFSDEAEFTALGTKIEAAQAAYLAFAQGKYVALVGAIVEAVGHHAATSQAANVKKAEAVYETIADVKGLDDGTTTAKESLDAAKATIEGAEAIEEAVEALPSVAELSLGDHEQLAGAYALVYGPLDGEEEEEATAQREKNVAGATEASKEALDAVAAAFAEKDAGTDCVRAVEALAARGGAATMADAEAILAVDAGLEGATPLTVAVLTSGDEGEAVGEAFAAFKADALALEERVDEGFGDLGFEGLVKSIQAKAEAASQESAGSEAYQADVAHAYKVYEALGGFYKGSVPADNDTIEALEAGDDEKAALKRIAKAKAALDEVGAGVAADVLADLPAQKDLKLDEETKALLDDARAAVDALPEGAGVDDAALDVLEKAYNALLAKEYGEADAVVQTLEALLEKENYSYTADDKAAIASAKEMYALMLAVDQAQSGLPQMFKRLEVAVDASDKAAAAEAAVAAIAKVTEAEDKTSEAYGADIAEAKRLVSETLTSAQRAELSEEIAALEAASDAYEVSKVERQIASIGTVTYESGETVTAARAAYEALGELKESVSEEAKAALEKAEGDYARAVSDKEAADAQAALDAKAAAEAKAEAERAAEEQRAAEAAAEEAARANQAAANSAVKVIDTIDSSSAADVAAAREAYDKLTEAEKALVPPSELEKLEAAENALANPSTGAEIADVAVDANVTVDVEVTGSGTVALTEASVKSGESVTVNTVTIAGKTYEVTEIAAGAFEGTGAKSVTVGKSVKAIGKNAFANAANLATVSLGANVKTIGAGAFSGCTALTKVTVPAKTTSIGKNAFKGATKLRAVTLGKAVKSVGANAFKGANKLKTVTVKSSKLTAKSLKNMVKGSKIKTVKLSGVKAKAKKSYTKTLAKYGVKVK